MKHFLKYWGPSLLLMGIIFFLSAQTDIPGPPTPLWDRIVKKSAHAAGYGMLAISYAWALSGSSIRRTLPLALILTLLYALSDEWHQSFVPEREGNLLDVFIDLGGGIVGLALWHRLENWEQFDLSP